MVAVVGMLLTEHLFANGEGPFVEGLRLIIPPLALIEPCEVVQGW